MLQVNGKDIRWHHLVDLYKAKMDMGTRSEGLYLLKKLKLDHIQLTSYSKMKVNLAAQVIHAFLFMQYSRISRNPRG